MNILAAARHPSAGEAVGPVVRLLRGSGHDVTLIGVSTDGPNAKEHGGANRAMESLGLDYVELYEAGYEGNVIDVPAEFGSQLIDRYDPDRILVGCSYDQTGTQFGIEEAIIFAGTERDIPVVQCIEAWEVWHPRVRPVAPTVYASLDTNTEKIMGVRGADPTRVVVTGHAGFDQYAELSSAENPEHRQDLGIAKNERLLVYFGQSPDANGRPDMETTLGWVVDCLQPDDRLIYAAHPRNPFDYSEVLTKAGPHLIATYLNSHQLLEVVDLAITPYSTMGLKSALMGIPTIHIFLDGDLQQVRDICGGFPISLWGASNEVHTQDELEMALTGNLSFNPESLKAGLNIDGRSADRIARLLTDGV